MRVEEDKEIDRNVKRKIMRSEDILEMKKMDYTGVATTPTLEALAKLSNANRSQNRRFEGTLYTASQLEEEAEEYFKAVNFRNKDELKEVPDVEGFALWLGVHRATINLWEKDPKRPELAETVKGIKSRIMYHKKQLAYLGKVNPTVFIFDSKNNHGYVDRVEVSNTNALETSDFQKLATMSVQDVQKQYEKIRQTIAAEERRKILDEMKENAKEVEIE